MSKFPTPRHKYPKLRGPRVRPAGQCPRPAPSAGAYQIGGATVIPPKEEREKK